MLQPGVSVGRYLVRQKLAEGGMAEIFLASALGAEGFSKDVVLKVIRPLLASDPLFVEMFIAEARLASKLNHPNIVQVFDFGAQGDDYYAVMEYVRGISLWTLRRRCAEAGRPFPPETAAEIAAQIARALSYAHDLAPNGEHLGLVHRDVTPQNILLSCDGSVKLSDFGIAKAASSRTTPGMLKGKFAYMSPEQSRGEPVDAQTDVFALGVVLWELLTEKRLFSGESDVAVLRSVQQDPIAPPKLVNPATPQELSDIVMMALARQKSERLQSAALLELALRSFLRGSKYPTDGTSITGLMEEVCKEEEGALDEPATKPPDKGTDVTSAHGPTAVLGRPLPPRPAVRERKSADLASALPRRALTEQMPALSRSPKKPPALPEAPAGSASPAPPERRTGTRTLVLLAGLALAAAASTVALGSFFQPRTGAEATVEAPPDQAGIIQPTAGLAGSVLRQLPEPRPPAPLAGPEGTGSPQAPLAATEVEDGGPPEHPASMTRSSVNERSTPRPKTAPRKRPVDLFGEPQ